MGNCMCRNTHTPTDLNEFKSSSVLRHSFAEGGAAPERTLTHRRIQSSTSTKYASSAEESPNKQSVVDLAEVCHTLNVISVKLEQTAQSDDRIFSSGRLKQLVQQTQQISTKLAAMQRSHPEQLTGRSSMESRAGLGTLDEELERQLQQLYCEMAEVMGEVETLSKQTLAMTKNT